jgi:hypothetical protein
VTIGLEFEDGIFVAGGDEAAPFLLICWSLLHTMEKI